MRLGLGLVVVMSVCLVIKLSRYLQYPTTTLYMLYSTLAYEHKAMHNQE